MNTSSLSHQIKQQALKIGFDKVGFAKADEIGKPTLQQWLAKNYHGKMQYMENHFSKRTDPRNLVEGALSIISVAKNYYTKFQHSGDKSKGKISRYAWGDDYHDVLKKKLQELFTFIRAIAPNAEGRVFVDSAPVMDKQWAVKAGIGWQGKNSNVISREFGSWIFLGEIILNIELDYDQPIQDFCGTCTRCIEACPTHAIVEPYVVDGSRCISYMTIELKAGDPLPEEHKKEMGSHIFGCDICQDVCPWNKKFARETDDQAFYPRPHNLNPDLKELSVMTKDEFMQLYKNNPVRRPQYEGFMRNVKNALGM